MADTGMVPDKETLTVEFKSDRLCLSDRELVESVVAMANTHGGELFLGVEDDGTPTGLHPNHSNTSGLAALVAAALRPQALDRLELQEMDPTLKDLLAKKIGYQQAPSMFCFGLLRVGDVPELIDLAGPTKVSLTAAD